MQRPLVLDNWSMMAFFENESAAPAVEWDVHHFEFHAVAEIKDLRLPGLG